MVGQTLNHNRIDAKIGEGGMGVVYRATDTHLDRPVTLKLLPAEATANEVASAASCKGPKPPQH
jgi:serine/threonine-protein kinase